MDRNILRLGIYELASEPQTSERITVNEAIELTNVYGAEGSARFINGVLGALLADGQEALEHILNVPESKDGN